MEDQEEFQQTILMPVFVTLVVVGLIMYVIFSASMSTYTKKEKLNPGVTHKAEVHKSHDSDHH